MQLLLQIMQTIIRPMRAILLLIWFISRLEKDSGNLSNWFKFNYLKCNEDKFQLLMNVDYPDLSIKVGNDIVHNSTQLYLSRIKIKNKSLYFRNIDQILKISVDRQT